MGIPPSEVGYTSAMPRREDHEVRKGYVGGGHWEKKKQWLNIPDAANIRVCPTVYSDWIYQTSQMSVFPTIYNDWIYRTPQISGFVRLCTVTEYTGRRKCQGFSDYIQWLEYTGRCKFQDFSDYVQWLNISDAANFRIYPNMYSDWRQYTGRHSFHLCSSVHSKCKRRQNWTMF